MDKSSSQIGEDGLSSSDSHFQSAKTSKRLNQIDHVRQLGIGDHISLPQLVVCGDQSAGKSSVLEGISGYPFPRQDGLCTRFPTEIILRHDIQINMMTASVLPSASRSVKEKIDASRLMGIRGFSDDVDAPSFASDVLRLELVGNINLHLTLVDLPGLISVSENDKDVEFVRELVDRYLESPRTIILAVIPASSDAETQPIIQRARHFDKDGTRTIGVITKPDLINKNTEQRVARLAKNLDRTKFKLGFFLLKNPSPDDLANGMTFQERRQAEFKFFSRAPWKAQNLDQSRIGIDNLRSFLEDLLSRHIEQCLPEVLKDIRRVLKGAVDETFDLGTERSTSSQIRVFLIQISMEIRNLITYGVEGNYGGHQGDFFTETNCRLRAAVHRKNESFAQYMAKHGQLRKFVADDDAPSEISEEEPEEQVRFKDNSENEQIFVTALQMSRWVKEMYHESRGQELSGNYNHSLLQRLFLSQSSRWHDISRRHVQSIVDLVTQFVKSVLKSVVKDSEVRSNLWKRIMSTLQGNVKNAYQELAKLLQDEQGHPITYNHYYTDNVQRERQDSAKRDMKNSVDAICSVLQDRVKINMVDRACSEALIDLNAYYKVARKSFVDNICRQVVERHILKTLVNVFDPTTVSGYSDEELLQLAAETPETIRRRTKVLELQSALESSLKELSI
ncbi:Dynamin [Penicillium taxi]|uniref:Dynamin n=1 Tax=Penicillium taxi TaxID=168475 RepID=UPI002545823B|nr:Dynamin [Penicillium taxi]KAJ5907937.1 Dynamin [Penicillium taxi]